MVTAIVLTLAGTIAADPATYALYTDTSVWDVAVQDINGDGNADVFALCCDENSDPLRKFVAVYLAGEAAAYSGKPSFTLELPPSLGALFFAEVDGAEPVELLGADGQGATVYRFASSGFERMASSAFGSLLPSGTKEPLFLKHAAEDLDGDGVDEWLIPVALGYQVRNVNGPVAEVACDVVSEIYAGNSTLITYRLPTYHLFDVEGENLKGLAFLSDEFADFAYGPGWSEHKRFRIPVNLEEKWEASSKMADINGNGLPDLVVTQTKGTVNLEVLTQVYLASAPFTYPDVPTATFRAKGAIASPALKDVDGDGRPDLVFISIPFGLKNFVNYFLRSKVSVDVAVYPFNGKGFPPKPTLETQMTLDAPEGRERVAYTMGDFNGDGRLDVAFGAGANEMAILTGSPERFVSARPWLTLELPTFGDARTYDLDGNKRDDIVLFHPTGDLRKRIEIIVF